MERKNLCEMPDLHHRHSERGTSRFSQRSGFYDKRQLSYWMAQLFVRKRQPVPPVEDRGFFASTRDLIFLNAEIVMLPVDNGVA